MIGPLAEFVTASNLFKIVLRYFVKVQVKSNVRILRFNWLICLYLFMSLVCIASFLIVKNSCVREELIDLLFFLQTQLQQITVQELLFCAFSLAPLTIQFWTKNMKKARTESSKNREKNDPKNRNGKILRTFGPYIFWPKLLKSVQILYIYY